MLRTSECLSQVQSLVGGRKILGLNPWSTVRIEGAGGRKIGEHFSAFFSELSVISIRKRGSEMLNDLLEVTQLGSGLV